LLFGNSTIYGVDMCGFSIAIFDYRRVYVGIACLHHVASDQHNYHITNRRSILSTFIAHCQWVEVMVEVPTLTVFYNLGRFWQFGLHTHV